MKAQETSITKIIADQWGVDIHFIPKGNEMADSPVIVRVTPHYNHILLSLSNAEFDNGCSCQYIPIHKIP